MRAMLWSLRMSLIVALVAATRVNAVSGGVSGVRQGGGNRGTTVTQKARSVNNGATATTITAATTTQREYVYRAEENSFTGTVATNDLKAKTITIEGHHPLRRETVERVVPVGSAGYGIKAGKPPPVNQTTEVFKVDAFCRILLTNKPAARLADIQSGDIVDVNCKKMADGTMVASTIRTAGKHPYDSPSATSPPKK